VQAHKVILVAEEVGSAPAIELEGAAEALRRAIERRAGDADVYWRLGSVLAWQGRSAEALDALRQAVDDALLVYMQWMNRYPKRAEGAVQVALVWAEHKGNRERATEVLRAAGGARGAAGGGAGICASTDGWTAYARSLAKPQSAKWEIGRGASTRGCGPLGV
jgi:hypothetical protein